MPRKKPWNKGCSVGQSRPLNPDQVDLIRLMFDQRANPKSTRDLALFNLALDSQLRGCDLVALKVRDVSSPEHGVHETVTLRQRKVSEGALSISQSVHGPPSRAGSLPRTRWALRGSLLDLREAKTVLSALSSSGGS